MAVTDWEAVRSHHLILGYTYIPNKFVKHIFWMFNGWYINQLLVWSMFWNIFQIQHDLFVSHFSNKNYFKLSHIKFLDLEGNFESYYTSKSHQSSSEIWCEVCLTSQDEFFTLMPTQCCLSALGKPIKCLKTLLYICHKISKHFSYVKNVFQSFNLLHFSIIFLYRWHSMKHHLFWRKR